VPHVWNHWKFPPPSPGGRWHTPCSTAGMRTRAILALFASMSGVAACGGADDGADPGATASSEEEISAAIPFVRSDQVHLGRAPRNTLDLQASVTPDFSKPDAAADAVIAALKAKPTPYPVYLGNVHTWVYESDASYRANIHTLASRVHDATGVRVLVYFEERNFSNGPTPVSVTHAAQLRALSKVATLLMATYITGSMTKDAVLGDVKHFHDWYGGTLGIALPDMLIDVDTSQTSSGAYYGTRGDLANFDKGIAWALDAAYAMHFGGFHTMGNASDNFGTKVASDSTYQALDAAWAALESAHPKRAFEGVRPR
jgi:hypothetical protein